MSENSKIEWTDVTDNIIAVKGGGWWCRKISPGCANCYAAKLNQNAYYGGNKLAYSGAVPDLVLKEALIDSWQRQRVSKRHFVASMTDVFGDWVPQEWINKMLFGMVLAPLQTFQVLTKRPDVAATKIKEFLRLVGADSLPPNIWIGTSVEDQTRADERVPHLLAIPAAVRFLSCEPLLEAVDLKLNRNGHTLQRSIGQDLHWVICGGESGPGHRPFDPDWARSLRGHCKAAHVSFFMKQMSGVRKPLPAIPDDLMIREFPKQ